jgi:hypothetical protein
VQHRTLSNFVPRFEFFKRDWLNAAWHFLIAEQVYGEPFAGFVAHYHRNPAFCALLRPEPDEKRSHVLGVPLRVEQRFPRRVNRVVQDVILRE